MKKKSSAKNPGMPKTWLITGLLAAGSIAYVVFIFLPLQHSINGLRGQVHERRQQIMQAQSLAGTLGQSRVRLASADAVSRLWKSDAPRQAQLITHYASLTQQAEEAGIVIDRLDPLPVVELNLIAQQNVTIFVASSRTCAPKHRRVEHWRAQPKVGSFRSPLFRLWSGFLV